MKKINLTILPEFDSLIASVRLAKQKVNGITYFFQAIVEDRTEEVWLNAFFAIHVDEDPVLIRLIEEEFITKYGFDENMEKRSIEKVRPLCMPPIETTSTTEDPEISE